MGHIVWDAVEKWRCLVVAFSYVLETAPSRIWQWLIRILLWQQWLGIHGCENTRYWSLMFTIWLWCGIIEHRDNNNQRKDTRQDEEIIDDAGSDGDNDWLPINDLSPLWGERISLQSNCWLLEQLPMRMGSCPCQRYRKGNFRITLFSNFPIFQFFWEIWQWVLPYYN